MLGAESASPYGFFRDFPLKLTRPDSARLSLSSPHDKASNLHFFGKTRAHTVAVCRSTGCQKLGPPCQLTDGNSRPFHFCFASFLVRDFWASSTICGKSSQRGIQATAMRLCSQSNTTEQMVPNSIIALVTLSGLFSRFSGNSQNEDQIQMPGMSKTL